MPLTPFRRTIDAALVAQSIACKERPAAPPVDKWEVLRALTDARADYGLSHRELSVLQALLSFHPGTLLESGDNLVVFPSNAAICRRLNGMACSTMRRHLAKLVTAGLLIRRDSANGKRFARRSRDGVQAYGFDLSPLCHQYPRIVEQAEISRAEAEALRHLRQDVSVMRRDLAALAELAREGSGDNALWDQVDDMLRLTGRALRRKLTRADLLDIAANLRDALSKVQAILTPKTLESSTTNARNEQHQHNSDKDSVDLETPHEPESNIPDDTQDHAEKILQRSGMEKIPLSLVLSVCPEAMTYATTPVRHWQEFVSLAGQLCAMMGIPRHNWDDACHAMGAEQAAIVVVALLERFSEIRRPGAYLGSLSRKAREGRFSCMPMIAALHRRTA